MPSLSDADLTRSCLGLELCPHEAPCPHRWQARKPLRLAGGQHGAGRRGHGQPDSAEPCRWSFDQILKPELCPSKAPCSHRQQARNPGSGLQVVSTVLAGAAVGSLTAQSLADNLGRRKAFLLDSIPLFLGPLLSALAGSLTVMLAGRAITGFGIGLASALVPLYISEVRPCPPWRCASSMACMPAPWPQGTSLWLGRHGFCGLQRPQTGQAALALVTHC